MNKKEIIPHSPEHINRLDSFIDRVLDHAKNYPKLEIYAQDVLKGHIDLHMVHIESMLGGDESRVNELLEKVAVYDSRRMNQAIATVTISGDDNSDIDKVSAELVEISEEYGGKNSTAPEIDAPLTPENHFFIIDNLQKLLSKIDGGRVSDRAPSDIPNIHFINFIFE